MSESSREEANEQHGAAADAAAGGQADLASEGAADKGDRAGNKPAQGAGASAAEELQRQALKGSLGQVVSAGMSGEAVSASGVLAAIGGWRGVLESLVPATVYLVVYVITQDPRLSAIAPLAIAGLAVLWRLLRREPLTAALSGVIGVVVCVAAVMFSGEGSSYFVPGFYINGAWILAHTVSLLVGWPLIGLLLGFLRGSLTEWKKIPALRRTAQLVTIFWILVFAARLIVQLPLYFADNTSALGIARLVMGVPLFALAILFTWLLLSRVSAMVDAAKDTQGAMHEETGSAPSSDE